LQSGEFCQLLAAVFGAAIAEISTKQTNFMKSKDYKKLAC
jgi:hypothetical protein